MKHRVLGFGLLLALLLTMGFLAVSDVSVRAESLRDRKLQAVGHSRSELHVKFDESAAITVQGNRFVSTTGKDISEINHLTNTSKISNKERLFLADKTQIATERHALEAAKKTQLPDLNTYYYLRLNDSENIDELVYQLKQAPYVAEAYAAPLPVVSPVSPDFTSEQNNYVTAAPEGMGMAASRMYPGATGNMVRIADIEYSWNTAHEDLSDARQATTLLRNGTPRDPFNDTNHGTATIGVLSADKNSFGVTGVVPDSTLHLVNASNMERAWDVANAVNRASQTLVAGDVILIEQQTSGPDGSYVPVEWVPAVYDAIRIATAKGIHVVEAAGNGAENLDDPVYGSRFPSGKADSGAIIVGSGRLCFGILRERRPLSTYGSRVDLQGYGECITTTGYGRLYSVDGQNAWYTDGYNGTSSASALVAAAVASVSSAYERHTGTNISPAALKSLLIQTGTPQDTTVDGGHIGPLPDVYAAIRSFAGELVADTTPPTAPANLTASAVNESQINLGWSRSIDTSDIELYEVYRDGVLVATTSSTGYSDTGLASGTAYAYFVRAKDAWGNVSADSSIVQATTLTPDTLAPLVNINSPANGAVIGTSVSIGVTASDNRAVTKIDLYIDGVVTSSTANTSTLTYTWNTKKVARGSHTILAKAYDGSGNVGQVSITVQKQ